MCVLTCQGKDEMEALTRSLLGTLWRVMETKVNYETSVWRNKLSQERNRIRTNKEKDVL